MNFDLSIEDYKIDSNLDLSNSSYVYGEVDPIDVCKFITDAKLQTENKHFLDIGSGRGKIVLYLSRFLELEFASTVGVEIDLGRFSKSVKNLEIESNLEPELGFRVEFIHSSFENLYFGEYDIIYCCNTIFSKEDNIFLYQKIIAEFNGFCILFQFNHILKPFLIKKWFVGSSWSNNVPIYLFFIP